MAKARRDLCQMCLKAEPTWLCIDSIEHTWITFKYETDDITITKEAGGFLVCSTCRGQIERETKKANNSRYAKKHPRKLKWIRWSQNAA